MRLPRSRQQRSLPEDRSKNCFLKNCFHGPQTRDGVVNPSEILQEPSLPNPFRYPPDLIGYKALVDVKWYSNLWTTLAGYGCWTSGLGTLASLLSELWKIYVQLKQKGDVTDLRMADTNIKMRLTLPTVIQFLERGELFLEG